MEKVITKKETNTWRNIIFQDLKTWKTMTRNQLVKEIDKWNYPNYHIRIINGKKTPVSNPDWKKWNNLG